MEEITKNENEAVEKPKPDSRIKKEFKRINKLLHSIGIDEQLIDMLQPVIENTAWMKVKLDDARQEVKDSQIVIEYNNGGDQKGIRENPVFKGYESLWKSYMQGMSKIIDCIPDSMSEVKEKETERPLTMLEVVRARKQA